MNRIECVLLLYFIGIFARILQPTLAVSGQTLSPVSAASADNIMRKSKEAVKEMM